MNDFVINVRQIMEYPLKGQASEADAVLLQTGALGGPYAWTTSYGLVTGALDWAGAHLAVGVAAPIDTGPAQIFTSLFNASIEGFFSINMYIDDDGQSRYWQSGPAAIFTLDPSNGTYQMELFPAGSSHDQIIFRPNGGQFQVTQDGMIFVPYNTVVVARDPIAPLEVATKHYVDDEIEDLDETLRRFIQGLIDNLQYLYDTATVWRFNGRTGNVFLTLGDVTGAGGAPINSPDFGGTPTTTEPPPTSNSDRIPTTAWVNSSITTAIDYVINNQIVSSFNGRHDDVILLLSDITGAGGAPLFSPALAGTPTAPTPPYGNDTDRIATTAFVQSAIVVKANINSPHFTGSPRAPSPPDNSDDDRIATTEWVREQIGDAVGEITFDIRRLITVRPQPPSDPRQGDLWWDSSKLPDGNGTLYLWYVDRDSGQWVDASPSIPGPPGRDGHARAFFDEEPPPFQERHRGTLWFDPFEFLGHEFGRLKVWDGERWLVSTSVWEPEL
jgi:hypothetical protein